MRKGFESITEFIFMEDEMEKADVILIPGGSHKELIQRAAELYKQGYADYILPSGGANSKLESHSTEFDFLKDEALRLGVPSEAILKEDKATHTFANAELSYEVCKSNNISMDKVILVCKNFHARRAYLTYKINFPQNTKIIVQSIVDGKGITKENWMYTEANRNRVMSEVMKIGKYFQEHIGMLK